jgi:hypothetical protein
MVPKTLVMKNGKIISTRARRAQFEIKNLDNKPISVAQFW